MINSVWETLNKNHTQSVSSVSIHHANSRFLTIHQTNDVIVRDVVGYNTFGHGFLIEDGVEQNTDRDDESCVEIGKEETFYTDKNEKRTYEKINTGSCEMLSG